MIRDKRVAYALLAYGIGLLLLAVPRCARAEPTAPPCRQAGAEVICNGADFERLINLLLDARKERDLCALRLSTCQTKPPPPCLAEPSPVAPVAGPALETPSVGRPVTAVLVAVTSGAALVAGAVLDTSPTNRVTLVGGGILGIGVATLLAVW